MEQEAMNYIVKETRELLQSHDEELKQINKALYSLLEVQKITTKNVDSLTKDVKKLTESVLTMNTLEKRISSLENSQIWVVRTIIGAIIIEAMRLIHNSGVLRHL